MAQEAGNLGIREIRELIERIKNDQVNDTRTADSIAQAEEWQKEGYRVELIHGGKIFMKIELEKSLFKEKFEHEKEFRKKIEEEHQYSSADLYKFPDEGNNS